MSYFEDDISSFATIDDQEMKYENFFNPVNSRRKVNYFREVVGPLIMTSGTLLSSLPASKSYKFTNGDLNPQLYPFTSISVDLLDGSRFTIRDGQLKEAFGAVNHCGYEPLRILLQQFTDSVHGNQDWSCKDIILTCGNQDSMFKIFNTCLNDGDAMIIPVPLYDGTKDILKPMNVDFIQCGFDEHGPCIKFLENELSNREKMGQIMPKIMYINPTGADPTGLNYSNQRRRELYNLACRYDFIILEDDPYYFINFDESEELISFLSMDTELRVIRLDSFSKTLGMGFRVGYVIAPKPVTEKLALYQEISSFPSTLVSILLHCTMVTLGFDGFKQQLNSSKEFYRHNRDCLLQSLEKHMKEIAEWNTPQAAMFIWVKIINLKHISQSFMEKCWQKLVIPCPGFIYYMEDCINCPYIRLGYSSITPDRIDEGIEILSQLIREEVASTNQQYLSVVSEAQ